MERVAAKGLNNISNFDFKKLVQNKKEGLEAQYLVLGNSDSKDETLFSGVALKLVSADSLFRDHHVASLTPQKLKEIDEAGEFARFQDSNMVDQNSEVWDLFSSYLAERYSNNSALPEIYNELRRESRLGIPLSLRNIEASINKLEGKPEKDDIDAQKMKLHESTTGKDATTSRDMEMERKNRIQDLVAKRDEKRTKGIKNASENIYDVLQSSDRYKKPQARKAGTLDSAIKEFRDTPEQVERPGPGNMRATPADIGHMREGGVQPQEKVTDYVSGTVTGEGESYGTNMATPPPAAQTQVMHEDPIESRDSSSYYPSEDEDDFGPASTPSSSRRDSLASSETGSEASIEAKKTRMRRIRSWLTKRLGLRGKAQTFRAGKSETDNNPEVSRPGDEVSLRDNHQELRPRLGALPDTPRDLPVDIDEEREFSRAHYAHDRSISQFNGHADLARSSAMIYEPMDEMSARAMGYATPKKEEVSYYNPDQFDLDNLESDVDFRSLQWLDSPLFEQSGDKHLYEDMESIHSQLNSLPKRSDTTDDGNYRLLYDTPPSSTRVLYDTPPSRTRVLYDTPPSSTRVLYDTPPSRTRVDDRLGRDDTTDTPRVPKRSNSVSDDDFELETELLENMQDIMETSRKRYDDGRMSIADTPDESNA